MYFVTQNNRSAAAVDRAERIETVQDMLDCIASARYGGGDAVMLYKESLPEAFFDLKTGLAGELLQKCSNYQMRLAIIGDFSAYKSRSLRDFIYESNKVGRIIFTENAESALAALLNR